MGEYKDTTAMLIRVATLEERRAQISRMRHVVSKALDASGIKDADQAAAVVVYALDRAGYEVSPKEADQ